MEVISGQSFGMFWRHRCRAVAAGLYVRHEKKGAGRDDMKVLGLKQSFTEKRRCWLDGGGVEFSWDMLSLKCLLSIQVGLLIKQLIYE